MDDIRHKVILAEDVTRHNSQRDAWVSLFGIVYDLTSVIDGEADHNKRGLILRYAGEAVDHLFDRRTGAPRTFMDPLTETVQPYAPEGLLPDTYRVGPRTDLPPVDHKPWWEREDLRVGVLSACPRRVRIVNTLTGGEDDLSIADEWTLGQIQSVYKAHNDACDSRYEWRGFVGGAMVPLDASKTLSGNGLPWDDPELEAVDLCPEDHPVTLALVFKDPL